MSLGKGEHNRPFFCICRLNECAAHVEREKVRRNNAVMPRFCRIQYRFSIDQHGDTSISKNTV